MAEFDPQQSLVVRGTPQSLPFRRRFFGPTVALLALEAVGVVLPLWVVFDLDAVATQSLLKISLPIGVASVIIWFSVLTAWIRPVRQVILARATPGRTDRELSNKAYRVLVTAPVLGLCLRTAMWGVGALGIGFFLHRYDDWQIGRAGEFAAFAGMAAFVVGCVRALLWEQIMSSLREGLFVTGSPLKRFEVTHSWHFALVACVVVGGVCGSQAAFVFFFVPISKVSFVQLQTFLPIAFLSALIIWLVAARLATSELRPYLAMARGEVKSPQTSPVVDTFKRTQRLPYFLASLHFLLGVVVSVVGLLMCRFYFGFYWDDAIIIAAIIALLSFAAAIYAALWHRDSIRPLLAHLTTRYRVPLRTIAPTFSLRATLLMSSGGIVLLACGMAMIWGFVQYKNQATSSTTRQVELGLSWVKSELQAQVASSESTPTSELIRSTMRRISNQSPDANAVIYFLARGEEEAGEFAVGGGPMGAPKLPWYVKARIGQGGRELVTMPNVELSGRGLPFVAQWRGKDFALGDVAVFYPSYRGRGQSMVRPLRELIVFFLVLFAACAGIVVVSVAQFVRPIRKLEHRADQMARGELADPVAAGGEGDEIGKLTFALEEMRRALRDKIRSTEEVNVDLERAVQMRTADLARKNRELAETLEKLTQTQKQLVRSEKLASIGQLVAGIAHEINNPVNAIVNTVGPLEETITDIESEDLSLRKAAVVDIRDMVRVVQSGAQRTKAIVSALHSYSRTDDDKLVEFDIDRSLNDSLELLRHLLRNHIDVVKQFGAVGKVTGHAGQINQVFMNLLTNAAQALSGLANGKITIRTRAVAESVVIEIGDNGPGISADVLPRIWDPFFTTKDVGEGTGLGLSIVHELVERNGGTIEVATEVGKGTTFVVTLPRRQIGTTKPNA